MFIHISSLAIALALVSSNVAFDFTARWTTLLAQKPVCDDAAVMALRGKWVADSPPRPQNVTVEQYQQAAKRTDAAHLLLLGAYPELVGIQEGRWWRTVGGPVLDGAPGLLSYYYIGGLSHTSARRTRRRIPYWGNSERPPGPSTSSKAPD